MNTDQNGRSTCPAGGEQYERYYSKNLGGWRYQYDYRTPAGKLFSCVAKTLEIARAKRDAWLTRQQS